MTMKLTFHNIFHLFNHLLFFSFFFSTATCTGASSTSASSSACTVKDLRRATVLVRVEHMTTQPSSSWSHHAQQLQLLLCVRDQSLAAEGIHNVLLVITDQFQMLACAAILEEGDSIFIRDALVCPAARCNGQEPLPTKRLAHSTLGSLVVDASTSLFHVQPATSQRHGPIVGGGKAQPAEHRRFVEAWGCALPCVYLSQAHTHMNSDCQLSSISPMKCEQNAFQTFEGLIVTIEEVCIRSACPYCYGWRLELIKHEVESSLSSRQSSHENQRYLCLTCQRVCKKTVKALAPCLAVIECGLHRCNVWLGENVINSLQLPKLKGKSDLQRRLRGRSLNGIALRCCDACTSQGDSFDYTLECMKP